MEKNVTQEERVKQFQLAIAKEMKLAPENLKVLEGLQEWMPREWLYLCAVDGMNLVQLVEKLKEHPTIGQIKKLRTEYLQEKFSPDQNHLVKEVETLKQQVEEDCRKSREIRNKAMAEFGKQQSRRLEEVAELREKTEKIEKQEKEIHMLQEKNALLERKLEEKRNEDTPLKKFPKGKMKFLCFQRRESKKFVEKYIQDDQFSTDQIGFLLECLEEGMSIRQIDRFAIPGASIEVMKRLKELQKGEK